MDRSTETIAVVEALYQAMHQHRIRAHDVAARVGINPSRLYRFLQGKTQNIPAFVYDIAAEFRFDLPLRGAPLHLGQYSRSDFDRRFAGTYRTIIVGRGSTLNTPTFESYRTTFEWGRSKSHATFKETGRVVAPNHMGRIAMYEGSNLLYLLSNSANGHGFRQICITRKTPERESMCGFLASMTQYSTDNVPFVCQIIYIPDGDDSLYDSDGVHDRGSKYFDVICIAFEKVNQEIGFSYGILAGVPCR